MLRDSGQAVTRIRTMVGAARAPQPAKTNITATLKKGRNRLPDR
jgi:hypothetical protein